MAVSEPWCKSSVSAFHNPEPEASILYALLLAVGEDGFAAAGGEGLDWGVGG